MAKLDLIISDLRLRIRSSGLRPGGMIPTQKELARELGVSVVTVGQAMRFLQQEGVIASTRGKGTVVSSPRSTTDQPPVYGLILTAADPNTQVLIQPLRVLQEACENAGHELRMFSCSSSRAARNQLRAWAKDVVACFVLGTTKPDLVQCIGTLGKPAIFYGELYRESCPPWAGQITVNVEATSLICLQYLINLGHRKVLLVRPGGTFYLESLGSFFASAATHLGYGDLLQQLTVPLDSSGAEVVEFLKHDRAGVTALIVDGGMRASRILHTLTQNGISVPEKMSLLALSGVDSSMLITPHLSRVENMTPRLGEKLLAMADEMIKGGTVIREHIIPHLIWGKTCREVAQPSDHASGSPSLLL